MKAVIFSSKKSCLLKKNWFDERFKKYLQELKRIHRIKKTCLKFIQVNQLLIQWYKLGCNWLCLPITVRFTSWFLVGASVKSTLHRYWPASAPPTSSMRSVAGKVSGRKWARAPTQWSKIRKYIRKLLGKMKIFFFAVYMVSKNPQSSI